PRNWCSRGRRAMCCWFPHSPATAFRKCWLRARVGGPDGLVPILKGQTVNAIRPLQRLLAATDLSAPARHAVERAALVAQAAGARLDLVHVAAFSRLDELRSRFANLPAGVEESMREQTQMLVDALAATVRARHGVEAATHVASGPLLKTIADVTQAVD